MAFLAKVGTAGAGPPVLFSANIFQLQSIQSLSGIILTAVQRLRDCDHLSL
jgi:hypothetical protein